MSQKNNNNDDDDDDYDEEEYNDLISQMQLLLIGRNQKKNRNDDDQVSNTNNRNEREDEGRELTREEELALLEKSRKIGIKKKEMRLASLLIKKKIKTSRNYQLSVILLLQEEIRRWLLDLWMDSSFIFMMKMTEEWSYVSTRK